MGRYRWVAVTSVALLAITGCSSKKNEAKPSKEVGLVLGQLAPVTGPLSYLNDAQQGAVRLAVDDINAAGGVLGKQVALTSIDSGTTNESVQAAAQKLIDDKAQGVVGPAAAQQVNAVLPAMSKAQVVQCSASAMLPGMTKQPDAGFFTRTVLSTIYYAQVIAEQLQTEKRTKVAIVARNDEWGGNMAFWLNGYLDNFGIANTIISYPPPPAGQEVANAGTVVPKITKYAPDSVVYLSLSEGFVLIRQSLAAGIKAASMYVSDSLALPNLNKWATPNDPNGIDGLNIVATSGNADFQKRLADKTDGRVLFGPQAYDCAMIIALAAEQAKTTVGAGFNSAVVSVTSGGTACSTFADCKSKIDAGVDINYQGASGPIDLDESREPTQAIFTWAQWRQGQVVRISDRTLNVTAQTLDQKLQIMQFIAAVQTDLQALGFYTGPINGQYDQATQDAVKAFQTSVGLPATGQLDEATLKALDQAVAAKQLGSTSATLQLQIFLQQQGFYKGPLNGIYTPETTAAVKAFQASLGVPQTGVMDQATINAWNAKQAAATTTTTAPPTTTAPTTAPPTTPAPTTAPPTTPAPTTAPPTTPAPTTAPPTTAAPTTVWSLVQAAPNLTKTETAVTTANFQATLSDPANPVTFFGPTDTAWGTNDPTKATADELKGLTVAGKLTTADLTQGKTLTTLNPAVTISVAVSGSTITLTWHKQGTATTKTAHITGAEQTADTGILHEVDALAAVQLPA